MPDIIGNRVYIELPGSKTYELPPLLISRTTTPKKRLEKVVNSANELAKSDLLPPPELPEQEEAYMKRAMNLAIRMVDNYLKINTEWEWGDSVLEWIRQCEISFGHFGLRNVLAADVWPHSGRSSFVNLLEDKSVPTQDIDLRKAVGLRLTFKRPPPLACFSDQFLLYLNGTVAAAAYEKWSQMVPAPVSLLPPERFHFEVQLLEGGWEY